MRLYLVRHGKAKQAYEDTQRPLSGEGVDGVVRVAQLLKNNGERPDVIWHSTKTRAAETARILAERLGCETVMEIDGLKPEDDFAPVAQRIEREAVSGNGGGLMLVGHLPYMGMLCSALLSGDADTLRVHFSEATIVCLERQEHGRWSLRWMVAPEMSGISYVGGENRF